MNKQDYIDGAESALLHTYNRFPLVIDHGDGAVSYTHLTLPTTSRV